LTKIMFVCHGNICRSPMAEIIMNDMLKKANLQNKFSVSSSATSYEEIGNPIYPPAKAELQRRGFSFEEHYSTKLCSDDYDKYDLFVLMDKNNLFNIKHIFNNDNSNKIHLLLEYTGEVRDVADPWYSGDFKKTFDDIFNGCGALLKHLTK